MPDPISKPEMREETRTGLGLDPGPSEARRGLWYSLLVLVGIWIWLFVCLWPQWSMYESYQYGCFVPVLIAALCWRRWVRAPAPEAPRSRVVPVVIACLAALALLPLRMVHEANSLWRTLAWPLGVPVLTIGLCWVYLMGGRSWLKHFGFPFGFVLTALPWPGTVENAVTLPLAALDTRAATELLFIFGIPAIQRGTTIELAGGSVGVDEACSGIRSLHSAIMISLFLGELYFLRPRSRVFLFVAGIVVTFLVNIGRTFALSWVSARFGAAGMQQWHDRIGLAEVGAYMAGLLALALWLRPKATARSAEPEPSKVSMGSAWPVPTFVCLAVLGWLIFVEGGTRAWFSLREAKMAPTVPWSIQLPSEAQVSTNLSKTVDAAYRADESTSAQWVDADGSMWSIFYMHWNHGSKTGQLAKGHWPEICLGNSGLTLRGDVHTQQYEVRTLKLPCRVYAFEDGGTPVHVFHCIYEERSGGESGLTLDLKPKLAMRIQAAWDGKRNLGQQLLEVVVRGYNDPATAEAAFQARLQHLIKVNRQSL